MAAVPSKPWYKRILSGAFSRRAVEVHPAVCLPPEALLRGQMVSSFREMWGEASPGVEGNTLGLRPCIPTQPQQLELGPDNESYFVEFVDLHNVIEPFELKPFGRPITHPRVFVPITDYAKRLQRLGREPKNIPAHIAIFKYRASLGLPKVEQEITLREDIKVKALADPADDHYGLTFAQVIERCNRLKKNGITPTACLDAIAAYEAAMDMEYEDLASSFRRPEPGWD